jgi:hypothetical protein
MIYALRGHFLEVESAMDWRIERADGRRSSQSVASQRNWWGTFWGTFRIGMLLSNPVSEIPGICRKTARGTEADGSKPVYVRRQTRDAIIELRAALARR